MIMSAKKENLRSTTGIVKDSNTIQTIESMETLKPDDVVVIIHLDDYKKSFEKMMQRIEKMDEKVNEQSVFLNENIIDHKKKGFLGRFRKD
jgi:NhaP-type Na+/H+ and K+/H+ antiporter